MLEKKFKELVKTLAGGKFFVDISLSNILSLLLNGLNKNILTEIKYP